MTKVVGFFQLSKSFFNFLLTFFNFFSKIHFKKMEDIDNHNIGEILRMIVKQNKLTDNAFEESIGVSKGFITNTIKKNGGINWKLMVKIRKLYKVDLNQLADNELVYNDTAEEESPIYQTKYKGATTSQPQENVIDMKNTIIENQAARILLLEELLDICKGNKK